MTRKKTRSDSPSNQIHALRVEQATGKLSGLPLKPQKAIGMMLGGWSMADHMRTDLAGNALKMAFAQPRHPTALP